MTQVKLSNLLFKLTPLLMYN